MATAIVLAAKQLLPSLNSPSKCPRPSVHNARAKHDELKKKLEEARAHRTAAQSEADDAEEEVRRLRRQLGTLEYGRKMQQIAVFEDQAQLNEQVNVMQRRKENLAEVHAKAYRMRDEVDQIRGSVRQQVKDAVKDFTTQEQQRQADVEAAGKASWDAHCAAVQSQQNRISELQKQLNVLSDCVVDERGRRALTRLSQNAMTKRKEKMQMRYQGELKKEQTILERRVSEVRKQNTQLLQQERRHLDNLRDKKHLEKNQESVALLEERAKLRKQVKEAREKTLLEEQRGSRNQEELEDSAIVVRAAKLAENEMAKKPTYSFVKEARETLSEIQGEFAVKAAEDAISKKDVRNSPAFCLAKHKFNTHRSLLECRKTFDVLNTKPSLAASPGVQVALDGEVAGAILLGEMSQLQDQIQEIKTKGPFKLAEDDLEKQMDAVEAEIEAIDPTKFLKELPEIRTTTPSTVSHSETSSSWPSNTGSYQSAMFTA